MKPAEIISAINKRLTSDVTALVSVEQYTGQLEKEVKSLTVRTPAAYTVYEGATYRQESNALWLRSMTFSVLIVTRSARAEEEAEIEALDLLEHVKTSLVNARLDDQLRPLNVISDSMVMQGHGYVIYALQITTSVDVEYED